MSVRERAILRANEAFYRAMRQGDAEAMDRLWARRAPVRCAHPGRAMLVGREAVMESWRLILSVRPPLAILCEEPHAVLTGGTALVLCVERLDGVALMAVNLYRLEDGDWRMTAHQAAEMP